MLGNMNQMGIYYVIIMKNFVIHMNIIIMMILKNAKKVDVKDHIFNLIWNVIKMVVQQELIQILIIIIFVFQ